MKIIRRQKVKTVKKRKKKGTGEEKLKNKKNLREITSFYYIVECPQGTFC